MSNLKEAAQRFLELLEEKIGRKIPRVKKIHDTVFGIKIEDNAIVGLGLYNCSLKEIPEPISNLYSLRSLVLSNNDLVTLPESLCNMESIKKIFLHKNKLKKLPESFGSLKSLKVLVLSNNMIETLPESIGNLQMLEKLVIFKNKLKNLPDSFGQLRSLREVNLFQNNLNRLPESIGSLNELQELNLDLNELELLPESIGKLESLKTLKLQRNKLGELPESFKNLILLNTLDLRKNKFTSIPGIIWPLTNLQEIYLLGNPLDNESVEILERDQSALLEFCRKKANITVFLSHAWDDQEQYRVVDLRDNLENRDEIYEVFICEKDLVGDIQEFMDEKVPQSQLLIFIGTKNSIKSSACRHEIALALSNDIETVPVKGLDVDWSDLNHIDLTEENKGFFDLGNKKGIVFSSDDFSGYCNSLYEYIKQYKREINLYEKDIAKLDKMRLKLAEIFGTFTDSEEYSRVFKNNIEEFENLLENFNENKISISKFFFQYFKIIAEKIN